MSESPTNIIRHKPTASPPGGAKNGSSGTIRFTCCNGHPIVVPVKLAGKRGTCSRCGVAVVIPLTDDREANSPSGVEEPTPAVGQGTTGGLGEQVAAPDFAGIGAGLQSVVPSEEPPPAEVFEGLAVEDSAAPAFGGVEGATTPEMDGIDNPTAVLVAKLFGESEHGGVVELHLKSGQIVMPLLYDFTWSRGTHGVFASENKSDNTITLTAVAWDSVEQVIVRKVKGLPDGMFE